MTTTAPHIKLFLAVLAAATFATAAPARASYGWPVKPFHEQHPVRGYFGDPRIGSAGVEHGTFHFGIDVSAKNGTAVYSPRDGIAGRNGLHSDVVIVSSGGGDTFEFWHITPAVAPGARVRAFRTVVGYINKPWAHVHFSETVRGVYMNPLRPGALAPYFDRTKPVVQGIYVERNGRRVGARVSGTVDLITEAWDTTPLLVAPPWSNKPVTPARIEWRLLGDRELAATSWRTAADFEGALPTGPFTSVYMDWTRQNLASVRGRYCFYLARGFDTHLLRNGVYHVAVRVTDMRGNVTTGTTTLTVANGV